MINAGAYASVAFGYHPLLTLAFAQELCIKLRPETHLVIKWYFGRVFDGHLRSYKSLVDAPINFVCVSINIMHERFIASFQTSGMEITGLNLGLDIGYIDNLVFIWDFDVCMQLLNEYLNISASKNQKRSLVYKTNAAVAEPHFIFCSQDTGHFNKW